MNYMRGAILFPGNKLARLRAWEHYNPTESWPTTWKWSDSQVATTISRSSQVSIGGSTGAVRPHMVRSHVALTRRLVIGSPPAPPRKAALPASADSPLTGQQFSLWGVCSRCGCGAAPAPTVMPYHRCWKHFMMPCATPAWTACSYCLRWRALDWALNHYMVFYSAEPETAIKDACRNVKALTVFRPRGLGNMGLMRPPKNH